MDGNSTSQASKRLATIVAVLTFCAGSVGAQHSHAAGVWTNEPAGANVVMDCPFNSVGGCAFSMPTHHLRLHPIRLPPSRPAAQ
jgi:hypothetical protein